MFLSNKLKLSVTKITYLMYRYIWNTHQNGHYNPWPTIIIRHIATCVTKEDSALVTLKVQFRSLNSKTVGIMFLKKS